MKKYSFLALALSAFLIFSACGKSEVSEKASSPAKVSTVETASFSKEDYYTDVAEDKAIKVTFSEGGITYNNSPIEGNAIEITEPGTYILNGKSPDAQVIINTRDRKTVRLVLSGLELTSKIGSPIYTKSEAKTVISLADNTTNTLADVSGLKDTKVTAALFCMGDLTINGGGTLSVSGNTNDAITSRGILKIMSGTIDATAVKAGLIGADGFILRNGNLNIKSGTSGIQTLNENNKILGYIQLLDGNATIVSSGDAVSSANTVYASGGTYSVTASGNDNPKGLCASGDIKILGGTFNISAKGNAVTSEDELLIDGGNFTTSSENTAFYGDRAILLQSGDINVISSLCGIEGHNISILGGNITINANEDGINADSEHFTSCSLVISGGNTSVTTADTGINSDGNISMTGGILSINAPTTGENNAIDYENNFEISGGTLFSSGSSADPEYPSGTSKQYVAVLTFKNIVPAGSCVTIRDELSNTVISHTAPNQLTTLVLSTEQFKPNTKYFVFLGDMKLSEFVLNGKISVINTALTQPN